MAAVLTHAPGRSRTRRLVLAGVLAIAIALAVSPGVAPADQTVRIERDGAPSVSLIGDSTLTGVRWYADYGALQRFDLVFSAESCRRTFEQSCISQEGYRSANVIEAMRTLEGELGQVLVVMSGYNDPGDTIDEAIDGVVTEARRQGVEHVVWLTLRTSDDVVYSDPQQQSSVETFRRYNERLAVAAEESDGYLQVADWAAWSNGAGSWFETDGIHLTPAGVDALTSFVATTVERVLAGDDVNPSASGWTVLVPGDRGDAVSRVQAALVGVGVDLPGGVDGVYGNDTMAAVAAYQRTQDGLQVTGAVDLATAEALGIVTDTGDTAGTSSSGADTDDAAGGSAGGADTDPSAVGDAAAASTGDLAAGAESTGAAGVDGDVGAAGDGAAWMWAVIPVGAIVLLVTAVALRRRQVLARRARRWARVHPATSPHRSVADQRRDGTLRPLATDPTAAGHADHTDRTGHADHADHATTDA